MTVIWGMNIMIKYFFLLFLCIVGWTCCLSVA